VVAINFSAQFAADVASGKKRQTIRQTQRAKVGDRLQLYTGQRTKSCRRLTEADPVVTRTGSIEIDEAGLKYDGHYQTPDTANGYARYDGFENFDQMRKWFFDRYETKRFRGFEIRWAFDDDLNHIG